MGIVITRARFLDPDSLNTLRVNPYIPVYRYDIILTMNKETILNYLIDVKGKYQDEGFLIKALFGSYSRDEADDNSDVDILVEATPEFASKYGFGAIARINEIQAELSKALGLKVDLADSTGMGKTAQRFIIDRAIYV